MIVPYPLAPITDRQRLDAGHAAQRFEKMRVLVGRVENRLLVGAAVKPVGEAAHQRVNYAHRDSQGREPRGIKPHHAQQYEPHHTVDDGRDRSGAQGLLDLVDGDEARCDVAGVAALEIAERQAQQVLEQAQLPIEREGRTGGQYPP